MLPSIGIAPGGRIGDINSMWVRGAAPPLWRRVRLRRRLAAMGVALVELPAGRYKLGEPGEERAVEVRGVLIGRWPVTNAEYHRFLAATGGAVAPVHGAEALADHPATDVSREQAEAYCAWVGARLPSGDEWEAAARGGDGRPYPWGGTFDPERCNCADSGWGWTVPVGAHPAGAGPFGAAQQAYNGWAWVWERGSDS